MDNVHDLKRTANDIMQDTRNQQPITLSAIGRNTYQQPAVSINATNGLQGVQDSDDNRDHQVVRINPNPAKRKVARRTIENPEDLNRIDPNEVIPHQDNKPKSTTIQDRAMSQLAAAVERKQNEYREFVKAALADDEENRERVEAGIETVNGEMQYMPNNLYTPIPEDQKVTPMDQEDIDKDLGVDYDDSGFGVDSDFNPTVKTRIDDFIGSNAEYDSSDEEEIESDDSDIVEDEEVNDYPPVREIESEEEIVEEPEPVYEEPIAEEPAPVVEEETEDESIFTPDSTSVVASALQDAVPEDFAVDEADFDDVTHETEENLTDEQIEALEAAAEKNLRSDVLKKIIKAGKRVNTSQFTVSNKVVSVKDALRKTPNLERTAIWPLMYAGRPFKASPLKGPEIAMLAEFDQMPNNFDISRDMARILYEHDASPYRPSTLEAWCKTIPLQDIDNVYAALYIASMKGANYMPMICQKESCRHAYLSEDIPFDTMVRMNNDDVKKRFESIRSMELTSESAYSYESVITVINDDFAIGIKMPSLFNILYEYNTLNNEFISKYASIIAVLQYVDYIYMIDPETSQFLPVGWKTYPGDYTKTYKSKIATYSKIFKAFSSTDFALMTSIIESMAKREQEKRDITFEVPAAHCPKCGSEIPAMPMTARRMLFTQQRLVTLVTMPIEK